jgi:hypothetical protein
MWHVTKMPQKATYEQLLSHCPGAPFSSIYPRVLCSLWAGYGQIVSIKALDSSKQERRFIVKEFSCPPGMNAAHRGEEDHSRKVHSYSVESSFYQNVSKRMIDAGVLVPELQHVYRDEEGSNIVMVLSDLSLHGEYNVRKGNQLDLKEGKALLSWLARFHAVNWEKSGADVHLNGLWDEGSFWQLGTRQAELEDIEIEWIEMGLTREVAVQVHEAIKNSKSRTIIHGDAKASNFFFFKEDSRIAGFDFQYVGFGDPMRDVAYLLCCSIKQNLVDKHQDDLLWHYHSELSACLMDAGHDAYDMEQMKESFELCVVDLARFMSGSRWWGNLDYIQNKTMAYLKRQVSR